jgi:integrase/recombinase XerD
MKYNWSIIKKTDFEHTLKQYRSYLQEHGIRDSTITVYEGNLLRYLEFCETDKPSINNWERFRETLFDQRLKRSTLNQYAYAARAYHEMIGMPIEVHRLEPNNQIPFFFTEEDIRKLFSIINNIKHLAMLQTLFYACLRASELCALNDEDVNLKDLTIRIREGKGGRDGIVYITNGCSKMLHQYLEIRPFLAIDGEQPLFYTDFGKRWDRTALYRMFAIYKKKAGIKKQGGLHVFSRHSAASIMMKNGCDIITIKEILRHKEITTTARYLHISETGRRDKYERYLIL